MAIPWEWLAPFAGVMAVVTALLVAWSADVRQAVKAAVVAFLLAMMASMLAGATVYFLHPSTSTLVEGLWLSGGLMSVSVFPLFAVFVREARRATALAADPPSLARPSRPLGFVPLVVLLVLANEFLMGWAFSLAAGVSLPSLRAGYAPLLEGIVLSPWFLFTMAGEMVLTVGLLWRRMPLPLRVLLLGQAAIMFLSPPALGVPGWVTGTIVVSSAAMIGLVVYLMEHLYRHPQLPPAFARYLLEVLTVYAAMMAGVYLWLVYGDPLLFAASVLLEMVVVFDAVVRADDLANGLGRPWTLRPHWTFGVLSTIFVAELFMGAVLDVVLQPTTYPALFPAFPLAGAPASALANAATNGFWFFASVTASTWFLAMMGVEMGALVVFKLRSTRDPENRIRLGLMIGCYAAFAVFYPSLYFGLVFPNAPAASQVPVLGWSMGLGSYPVAIGVFGALLLTYLIFGILVVLFGRRVVCSVFCTAALMFQGTTIDAMKSFNRTSPAARRFLSSRISGMYSVAMGLALGGLTVTTVASYLDTAGRLQVSVGGSDPAVFLFALSFSVLWYVLFVSIPYAGNYNCVTMGWCYTGTIAQAFHKLGFFKLKVRDPQVCRECTTLDCAKGCPVGLVDMPGHFRTRGEFRSSKCCGVGDCVEMCPHDNLYVSDVRHWIRRRLGRPETRARGARLPMIPTGPRRVPATVSTTRTAGSPSAAPSAP